MPSMTQSDIERARYGEGERREAVNIPFPPPPETDAVIRPEQVERTEPNPRLAEPPVVSFTLHQYKGDYVLPPRERAGGGIRAVGEPDIEEFLFWGFPRIQQFNPRASREGMLSFLKMAVHDNYYRAVRTDNCFGLFYAARTPWEPELSVVDIGVYDKPNARSPGGIGNEVVRVYRAGLEWAVAMNAAEFRFASDNGYDLDVIAKRIGMDEKVVLYKKRLK